MKSTVELSDSVAGRILAGELGQVGVGARFVSVLSAQCAASVAAAVASSHCYSASWRKEEVRERCGENDGGAAVDGRLSRAVHSESRRARLCRQQMRRLPVAGEGTDDSRISVLA